MKLLFELGKIGGLTVKNRAVMPPMMTMFAGTDGMPTERIIRYYEERARGGVGLIICEGTMVDVTHCAPGPNQLTMTAPKALPHFERLTEAVHKYDCRIFLQLHHLGALRVPQPGLEPWGVSDVPFMPGMPSIHPMTEEEIKTVEGYFIEAARLAQLAGFDGVELHGAHSYLIGQFLSPYYNTRKDSYGGSAENRVRFVRETAEGIRRACGRGFPVGLRMPGNEYADKPGMMDAEECRSVAVEAAKYLDFLDISNGCSFNPNANCDPYFFTPGWKQENAKGIRAAVDIPVIATNTVKEPQFAEKTLEAGVCDFVALGRSHFADPDFMKKAAEGDDKAIRKCLGCMYCRERLSQHQAIACAINPRMGCEYEYPAPRRNGGARRIVVVGAGPAGMQAAAVLAEREFRVTLLERGESLGGTLNLADKAEHKENITRLVETMGLELERLGVEVCLGTEATPELLHALAPEAVFWAAGAEPIVPPLPGIEGDNVCTAEDVISGKVKVFGSAVIIGTGMTGLECAEKLGGEGCRLTLVDMLPEVGAGIFNILRNEMLKELEKFAPEVHTGCRLEAVTPQGAVAVNIRDGSRVELNADKVVLSLGVRPRTDMLAELKREFGERLVCVGDSDVTGRIYHAIKSGFIKAYAFEL